MQQSGTNVVHYEMYKTSSAYKHWLKSIFKDNFPIWQEMGHGQLLEMQSRCISLKICAHIYSGKAGVYPHAEILYPRYVLPSHKYFAEVALSHLYKCAHEKITRELEGVSFYSASTDLLSSRTMQPYMSRGTFIYFFKWGQILHCGSTAVSLLFV